MDIVNICVVGTGYVGLVTGTCFAEMGNNVWCVDIDAARIESLKNGFVPIYEQGLEELLRRNIRQGRLFFTSHFEDALHECSIVIIAVGTPEKADGSADLQYVFAVARDIGCMMDGYKVVVTKSTVPVGTSFKVKSIISQILAERGLGNFEFDVVSCPEFLKEGSAVDDFMKPDRVIIGSESKKATALMEELYSSFVRKNNRIQVMSILSAELTKYASNAMLAARISFMNELSRLCERTGADIEEVRMGIGSDSRIGRSFLYAGLGYGGSCFPKDVKALKYTGEEYGICMHMINAIDQVNKDQKTKLVAIISNFFNGDLSGKTIAIWGLAFKPHTDDMREAPSIDTIVGLRKLGAIVQVFDPEAMKNAREIFGDDPGIKYYEDNYDALVGADALALITEWPQFRHPNFEKIKKSLAKPLIFDGRNQYDINHLRELGFDYYCIGRGKLSNN